MVKPLCAAGPWAWAVEDENLVIGTGGKIFAAVRLAADATICALMLSGNAYIICALLHQRWCRKETLCPRFRVSSLFVISLVVADMIGGFFLLFKLVTQHFCIMAEILTRNRYLCLLRTVGLVFSASISISSLAAISLDRYVAILHSLRYPELMTRRRAGVLIGATWLYAGAGALTLFFWNEWRPGKPCHEADNIPLRHALLVGLPMCFGVAFLLVITHILIRREVARMHTRRRNAPGNIFGGQVEKNSEKSVRAVILVIGCFCLCWIPVTTFLFLRLFGYRSPTMEIGLQVAFSVANLNAVLNPFIYSWKNASVRGALQQFSTKLAVLLKCSSAKQKKPAQISHGPPKSIQSAPSTVSISSSTSGSSTSTTVSSLSLSAVANTRVLRAASSPINSTAAQQDRYKEIVDVL